MPSSRHLDRLEDIVTNCERIARHTAGMSRDAYFADEKTIDAVERCLQRISEAAMKLGPELDARYGTAPWKQARGIGNILRHKYDEVVDDLIWASIEADIPRLRESALREIARLRSSAEDASTA
ncbi:MAG: DUF86 domain-containing protein [Alphaproteobacteria bacterium]